MDWFSLVLVGGVDITPVFFFFFFCWFFFLFAWGSKKSFFPRSSRKESRNSIYARSPRMRRASWMSLGMMVTRLAWMAAKLVSSKSPTR